jgi:hypothetical protein
MRNKMYETIHDIINKNKEEGMHFFSKSTMHFFKSKVYPTVYFGRFFITSEKSPASRRMYTVREANPNGDITSHKFYEFYTYKSAEKYIKENFNQNQ